MFRSRQNRFYSSIVRFRYLMSNIISIPIHLLYIVAVNAFRVCSRMIKQMSIDEQKLLGPGAPKYLEQIQHVLCL